MPPTPKKARKASPKAAKKRASSTLNRADPVRSGKSDAVLWTRNKIANAMGLSRAVLTGPTKVDGELGPAMHSGKVDISSPTFQIWAAKRGCDLTMLRLSLDPATFLNGISAADLEIDDVPDLTIAQACSIFGSIDGLTHFLRVRKDLVDIRQREHNLAKRRGEMIDAELVRNHLFSLVDATNRRLLNDFVKTAARQSQSMAHASDPIEEIEAALRDLLSSELKSLKRRSRRKLKEIAEHSGADTAEHDETEID